MKPFHVACVVSALAATASGSSINLPPPSPVKLSHTPKKFELPSPSPSLNQRRSVRGPLPRILKRARSVKQKKRSETRDLLSPFTQRASSVFPEDDDYPQPTTAQLLYDDNEFLNPDLEVTTSNIPRRIVRSGIPGFVEIAIPDPSAGLARTVSGLAYTSSPDSDGDLELGTSASHSTQFFLSPLKHIDGSSLHQLKALIPDSTSFKTVEHCATFATSPSGPLSLKKCGNLPGFSQRFSYDPVSGELQPAYPSSRLNSNDENVPVTRLNKRHLDESTSSPSASLRQSKRASTSSSPSSAVLYFIPAVDANKAT